MLSSRPTGVFLRFRNVTPDPVVRLSARENPRPCWVGGFPVSRVCSRQVERGGVTDAVSRVVADSQASRREDAQILEIGDFDVLVFGDLLR